MSIPQLLTQNLSFHFDNTNVAFNDLSLSFTTQKYGIVGDNGVGKTTLLKLLAGFLQPEKGSVKSSGDVMYLPQTHHDILPDASLSTVIGVDHYLAALKRVNAGCMHAHDCELLEGQWDIESRIQSALSTLSLWPIDLETPFQTLSGGQKTKALLAKTLLFNTDFILMDEPTNNLDLQTRQTLYHFIEKYNKGIIVISHDRTLLNLMDEIIEITSLDIKHFGGNFDFYTQQKKIAQEALKQAYTQAQQSLKKTKAILQETKEKHERLANRGRKAFQQGHVDKLTARSKQGRSEKTHGKIAALSDKMIQENKDKLNDIASQIEDKIDISGYIEKTTVPKGKTVLSVKSLSFQYHPESLFIFNNFNIEIIGAERAAITGANGTGKSTLLKLINGDIKPSMGNIKIGIPHAVYLDQSVSLLDPNETLIENFMRIHPDANSFDAYHALAAFLFRNKEAEKKVSQLSGGEKIRAGLAVTLMSKTPPQLLMLDEPTNHLDLRAIHAIETILLAYQGALLVVSHDNHFLDKINIEKIITL